MTNIFVVLPKLEDSKNIKNLLVRSGIPVTMACATGAQAISQADGLNDGIIICSYQMADMIYMRLRECVAPGFELLMLASPHIIEEELTGTDMVCLPMPLKAYDLVNTVGMLVNNVERRRKRLRAKPRERDEAQLQNIKKAKTILMDRNHMTEDEAHRYIQKCSMDSGTNMAETAQMILSMYC